MNEEIRQLTDLQVIDLKIAGLDEEIHAGEDEINKIQKTFDERRASIGELTEKIEAAEVTVRELEAGHEDELTRIKDRQSKMMQVQTNREYHSILKEIEDGKRANKERDEETVQLMEQTEALSKTMSEQEELIAEDEKLLAEETERVTKETAKFTKKKTTLTKKRAGMIKKINPNLFKRYDMLRERRNGRAVVVANSGVCQGCFMNIPPQQYNELLRGDKMIFCPTCNRILYHQPEPEDA